MPIVGGRMYAELHQQLDESPTLNVLILSEVRSELLTFMSKLEVVHRYIQDRSDTVAQINVHAIKSPEPNVLEQLGVITHELKQLDKGKILELAKQLDIDVIADVNQALVDDKNKAESDFLVVSTYDDVEDACEVFLTGNGVAWTFKDAMWNMTWFARYYMRPGLCNDYFNFMGRSKEDFGYTDDQLERVRYMTNRIGQVEYCKDMLNFFLQRKRKASRHSIQNQDFSFELNYHLSSYYFLISGGLDILARLLNDAYELGVRSFMGLGLEKDDLIKALQAKKPELASLLTDKETKKWIEWLKERRNYIAHEAGMHHTQLVQEKETKVSDEELNKKIDAQADWALIRRMMTPEQYESQREMVASIIRLEDYEEVASDIMVVKTGGNTKLFSPLNNVDYDYGKFEVLTRSILEKLTS